jgi:hypothetical protein
LERSVLKKLRYLEGKPPSLPTPVPAPTPAAAAPPEPQRKGANTLLGEKLLDALGRGLQEDR